MTEYANITFNSVELNVKSLSPIKTQKTVKQILGKSLTETRVLGVSDQQWKIKLNGVIVGTTAANLSTNRADIEGLDTDTGYGYVDGIHNGTYILVPGSLAIKDSAENVESHYNYSMTLIEQ